MHMNITVFSHSFRVDKLSSYGRDFCVDFSRRYISWKMLYKRGRFVKEPDKVYAAASKSRTYFVFHINCLDVFRRKLIDESFDPAFCPITISDMPTAVKANLKLKPGLSARDYQEQYISYLSSDKPRSKLVGLQTGKGKAQPEDSLVLTPIGWREIGSLVEGDRVFTADGEVTNVINIYKQGFKQENWVEFIDGRLVACCDEHLWNVVKLVDRMDGICGALGDRLTVTTKQLQILMKTGYYGVEPIGGPSYFTLTEDKSVADRRFCDCVAFDTPIDDWYLPNTRNARLHLLKFLYDAFGFIDAFYNFHFVTEKTQVAQFFERLVQSLGGLCIDYSTPLTHSSKINKLKFFVREPDLLMTTESRLKRNELGFHNQLNAIPISKIVTRDKLTPMRCIEVAHVSKTYITDNYIPTHNTFCALKSVENLGLRTLVIVQSKYIEKWYKDIIGAFDIKKDRIVLIEGSASLMALLLKAKEGQLNVDFIIVSLTTLQRWFSLYEEIGNNILPLGYACTPFEWTKLIGAGVRITDEVHQHFHAMFKIDLYGHVEYAMPLSATLLTKDKFLEDMYEVQYPKNDRAPEMDLDRYAYAYAVHYSIGNTDKIRTTYLGNTMYSHSAFEESIIKNREMLKNYIELIERIVDLGYFQHKLKKKKCVVFCATVDMCTILTEHFKKKYPKTDIRRYVGEDPYCDVIDAEIRFTTNGSCGAAIDIPDLVCVVLTTAIESIQSNIQILGRLRKIEGEEVGFYFFTADNIDTHVRYYADKRKTLSSRVACFNEVHSAMVI
jgi:superfamily II DNA or RNA helicase